MTPAAQLDYECVADNTGATDTSDVISRCIEATPNKGRLLLAAGTYKVSKPIFLLRSDITITTKEFPEPDKICLLDASAPCALFKMDPGFESSGEALLNLGSVVQNIGADRVTVDHIAFHGSRAERQATMKTDCINRPLFLVSLGNEVAVTHSAFVESACGASFAFAGVPTQQAAYRAVQITHNLIADNGYGRATTAPLARWSDGLTISYFNGAKITNNTFRDNTDVSLILGSAVDTEISHNTFLQTKENVYAAFMLTNWTVLGATAELANFTGLHVHHNTFDCANKCDIAMQLGVFTWGVPTDPVARANTRVFGGLVENNTIKTNKQGINVAGVGPTAMIIRRNDLSAVPVVPNNTLSIGTHIKTVKFSWPLRWSENVIDLDDLSQLPDLDGDETATWYQLF